MDGEAWWAIVHGVAKSRTRLSDFPSHTDKLLLLIVSNQEDRYSEDPGSILSLEDPLEEEMPTHSSILVRIIPWTEEPGRLQSIGL